MSIIEITSHYYPNVFYGALEAYKPRSNPQIGGKALGSGVFIVWLLRAFELRGVHMALYKSSVRCSFPNAIGHCSMAWECYFDNRRNQIVVIKPHKSTHEIKVDNIYQSKLENKVISPLLPEYVKK